MKVPEHEVSQSVDSVIGILREQSRTEEHVNSALHALAALGVALVIPALIEEARQFGRPFAVFSVIVLTVTTVLLYITSALYHALTPGLSKQVMQAVDRAAILFMIAGTYTPVALLMLGGALGEALCVAEWVLAIAGALVLWIGGTRTLGWSVWFYQIMGWLGVVGAPHIFAGTPINVIVGIAAGGLAYAVGVLFLIRDRVPYFHAVSHIWVICGTAVQLWAISDYLR